MPNIYGKYSLTEIAKQLNVTPAFINRIQRETGIGGNLGTKGELRFFEETDYKSFKIVNLLRKINFSFYEIKEIWNNEKEIQEFYRFLRNNINTKVRVKWVKTKMPLIIHGGCVYYPPNPRAGSKNDRIKQSILNYYKKIIEYKTIAEEAKKRSVIFTNELQKITLTLKEISITWEEILDSVPENIGR